jgi:uncharacterized membrane protein YdjX (TVP38/TMEM64 family)
MAGDAPKGNGRRELIVAGLKAAALLVFLGAATWVVALYHRQLWHMLTRPDEFKDLIVRWGMWGPLAYIGFQVVQIVIFVIPGEITQSAAGYLFGPWLGALYCLIGAALGSALAFLLADALGRPLVRYLVGAERFERLEKTLNERTGIVTVFILFVIPGMPKDTLCYIAGLTPMHFWTFVLVSTLARVPGILLSTLAGDSVADRRYHEFLILCGVALALLILGLIFQKRLQRWMSGKRKGSDK